MKRIAGMVGLLFFYLSSVNACTFEDFSTNELIERAVKKRMSLLAMKNEDTVAEKNHYDFFWLVKNEWHEWIKLLLKQGNSPQITDEFGETPLHWAAALGAENSIVLFLNAGTFFDCVDDNGKTPADFIKTDLKSSVLGLISSAFAMKQYRLALLKIIMNKGVALTVVNKDQQTLLHRVAMDGDLESMEFLLNCKISPNLKDKWGRTPLHYAAKSNDFEMIKKLVGRGAFFDVSDDFFKEPCDMANDKKIRDCFLEIHKLFKAAKCDDTSEPVKELMLKHNLGVKRYDGTSLLHEAAANGSENFINTFCFDDLSLPLDSEDNRGYTPLAWALMMGHQKVALRLCRNGASFFAGSKSPLILSIDKRRLWFLKKCWDEAIFSVEYAEEDGTNLLHWAALKDRGEIARELLVRGIPYNSKVATGLTPMQLAGETVRRLLKKVESLFSSVEKGDKTTVQEIVTEEPYLVFVKRVGNEGLLSIVQKKLKSYIKKTAQGIIYKEIENLLSKKMEELQPKKVILSRPSASPFIPFISHKSSESKVLI